MRFAAASLAWVGMMASPAVAAPPPASSRIVLPAMPLGHALLTLAGRTGRNILFRTSDVAGRLSPPIDAAEFEEALEQILRRNDLVATRLPGGAIRLTPRQLPPPVRRAVPRLRVPSAPRPSSTPDIVVHGNRVAPLTTRDGGLGSDDLLTPADIRRLPDRTVAEALGRLPGVLTLATSLEGTMGRIDHAARAIGDFVAVRGLPGSYLETRIDGVELPQSLAYSRGAQLGLATGEPGTTLRLDRILGADRSGEAIAGQLNIDHASPFADSVQGVTATVSGGRDDRSVRLGQDADRLGARLSIGTRTAGRDLALYVSAGVARTPFTTIEQTFQNGNLAFAVADANGGNPKGLDAASNLRLASVNAQATQGVSHDIDAHVGIAWRPEPRLTLLARFSGAWRMIDQNIYQISAQGGRSLAYFTLTPIGDGLYGVRSTRSEAHYWFQTNPERDRLGVAQLSASWNDGPLLLQARLFGAEGHTDRPDHIEMSFWSPDATRLSGGVTPLYRDGLPLLQIGPGDAAILADPTAYPIHNEGERASEYSSDRRIGADIDARFDHGEHGTFHIGATLLRSDRRRSTDQEDFSGSFASDTRLGQTGLVRGQIGPLLPGVYDYVIPVMDNEALVRRLDATTPLPQTLDDRRTGASAIREDRIAVHAALAAPVGDRVTMTMGLRLQTVDLGGRFWLAGHDGVPANGVPYGWNVIHARYRALLPSISARWHKTSDLTVDAALWTSQTRPSPYQLTGGGGVTQDSQGGITIQMPNPDLKPVDALNLDLAVDWHPVSGLSLSLAGFAKRLEHYLYDAGDSQNNAGPDDREAMVRLARSRNGGIATIAGVETSVAVPLGHLVTALRNWSLGGQLTMLDSRVRLQNPALAVVERLQYAPALSTRSWLRYDDGHASFDLSWRTSSPYVQEYGLQVPLYGGSVLASSSALDSWVHPVGQLDFGMGLTIGRSLLRFAVRNATDITTYRSSIGRFTTTAPQTIIGGRQIQFSISTRR